MAHCPSFSPWSDKTRYVTHPEITQFASAFSNYRLMCSAQQTLASPAVDDSHAHPRCPNKNCSPFHCYGSVERESLPFGLGSPPPHFSRRFTFAWSPGPRAGQAPHTSAISTSRLLVPVGSGPGSRCRGGSLQEVPCLFGVPKEFLWGCPRWSKVQGGNEKDENGFCGQRLGGRFTQQTWRSRNWAFWLDLGRLGPDLGPHESRRSQ